MSIDDQHNALPSNGTTALAETAGLAARPPTPQGATEGWFEPDACEYFKSVSGYPKPLAHMLALCASELVQLGEDPFKVVKIARHAVSHGYYASRALVGDAEAILAEDAGAPPVVG